MRKLDGLPTEGKDYVLPDCDVMEFKTFLYFGANRLRSLLFSAWVILLGARVTLACSCMVPAPPACQEAWRAALVFAGTVTKIEVMKDEQSFYFAKVHFAVTTSFIGLSADSKEVDVITPSNGAACGFGFERGHDYLVYADKTEHGDFRTNHCMRTALLADALEDLAYLRSLPARKPVGQISGFAFDSQVPMPEGGAKWPWGTLQNVRVTVHSKEVQKTAATDASGRFSFSDLPPGNYSVAAARSGYWAGKPNNVVVPAKGCAEVYFDLNIDRVITGRLLDQFGRRVPNVMVDLISTAGKSGYLQSTSDADGHFEFRRLQPGQYYLGVSLINQPLPENPYQRWYYPGVTDVAKAWSISVDQSPKSLSVDLPLPEAQEQVTVNGIVEWPDGRPADGLGVFPENLDVPSQLGMIRFATDEHGKFEAKLFDRTKYRLFAVAYDTATRKYTSAEPVTIIPGQVKEGTIIRLVLSHDGDLMTPEANKR